MHARGMIKKAICRKQLELGSKDGAPASNGISVAALSVGVTHDVANVLNMLC